MIDNYLKVAVYHRDHVFYDRELPRKRTRRGERVVTTWVVPFASSNRASVGLACRKAQELETQIRAGYPDATFTFSIFQRIKGFEAWPYVGLGIGETPAEPGSVLS